MNLKRIVFLDRDGVININPRYLDYIKKPSEFKFLVGAKKGIRMLNDAGFQVFVISNQSGVSKGLFSKKDLNDIDKKMIKGLRPSGGRIKKSFYCIHPTEANCDCKKPKTGMLKKATKGKRIDFKNSFFIGDTERDIIAGKSFGVKTIAVLSGYYNRRQMKLWEAQPDFITKDLLSAAKLIKKQFQRSRR
jgi:D-glycero-D-manno-heptose 1,7-bisphosphate phosphatase